MHQNKAAVVDSRVPPRPYVRIPRRLSPVLARLPRYRDRPRPLTESAEYPGDRRRDRSRAPGTQGLLFLPITFIYGAPHHNHRCMISPITIVHPSMSPQFPARSSPLPGAARRRPCVGRRPTPLCRCQRCGSATSRDHPYGGRRFNCRPAPHTTLPSRFRPQLTLPTPAIYE